MPVILLALARSDAALHAQQESGGSAQSQSDNPRQNHVQTPGATDWTGDKGDCRIFFPEELKGLGTFKAGPRCAAGAAPMSADERLPASLYAFASSLVLALVAAVGALVVLA
jgi:hypothetical protein